MDLVSYIIRIYRRDDSDPCRLAGIVEDIEAGGKQRFNSFDELKVILGAPKRRPPAEKKESLTRKHGK